MMQLFVNTSDVWFSKSTPNPSLDLWLRCCEIHMKVNSARSLSIENGMH